MIVESLEKINKPYKIYAEVLDPKAVHQFEEAMMQDCVVKGALMPDAHLGYTVPIGSVIATDGIIFPSFVGYDIGCGMCALKTPFKKIDIEDKEVRQKIFDMLYERIPVGQGKHDESQVLEGLKGLELTTEGKKYFEERFALRQLGTLGSGNHFLEVAADEAEYLWIVLHSGSRGFGWKIAEHYMIAASTETRTTKKGKVVPVTEGHFGLRTDSDLGRAYINDMNYALAYALANRKHMLLAALHVLKDVIMPDLKIEHKHVVDFINRNHNHAVEKDGLYIHRKGATHAEEGMRGVIPGNMRDGSYIVTGKGNPDSLHSSSHGAGRVLGREAAKKALNVEDFKKEMEGITAKVGASTLDESPKAYKDIHEVMQQQSDLVTVDHHVKTLINMKA